MKATSKETTQPTLLDQALAAPDPTPGYLVTKVSVSFLTADPDAILNSRVMNIIFAMTNNEYYTSLQSELPAIATANGDFANAMAAAADGGKQLNAAKRAARAALVSLVRPLGGKVELACQNNMTILLSSGFPVQKPNRTPAQVPATPLTPSVSQGLTGEANVVTGPVEGAYVYNWRVAQAETPGTFFEHVQSTGGRVTIDSLTPGKIYLFQVNAVGTAGTSDWSNTGSLMVI